MNKADLVDRLEVRLGSKKAALEAVEAVVDVIIREVAAGNKVGITGFGTFERVDRAARTGAFADAAIPLAVAKHASAPSSSRRRSWNISTVGFP